MRPSDALVQNSPDEGYSPQPEDTLSWVRLRARHVKAGLGRVLYRTGLYEPAWRGRAAIVLFHRVDDRYPADPITCSRAQFAAFCDFFARYFTVVSLSELLERLRQGADISRRLVITFDDGYRDNYEWVAAELRQRGLPACFFVTTAFLDTQHAAWWDAQRSIQSEWMSWRELRSLRDQGFEIGSHTMTHADCGRITGDDAVREIAGSKAQIEAEIGPAVKYFAFPYGGVAQMSEANRSIVRDAGFSCCLSAHGGVVFASDSPFRLMRVPINTWYVSPYQFGFEALQMAGRVGSGEVPGDSAPNPG